MNIELPRILFETTLATSAAALLVLALRRPLMARLGASVVYALWALVPVAGLAMLLPAPDSAPAPITLVARTGVLQPVFAPTPEAGMLAWTSLAMVLWASGVLATAALFAWQQWRFQYRLANSVPHGDGLRIARGSEGLPAVIGLLRPRIVLPADFETRYDVDERELILCHERIHVARRDLWANAVAAVLRALFWFNPVLHYAAWRFRRDQELACDERVVARHPQRRRDYAGAMLKTQMADSSLPVGCHWQASTPLKERIAMLKEHAPKPMRSVVGAALVSLLLIGGGYTAWAAQPANAVETVATSDALYYAVNLRLTADGESNDFKMITRSGKPFSFKNDGKHVWSGEFTADEWQMKGQPAVMLAAMLSKDGKQVASPKLGLLLGRPGSIEIKDDNGSPSFRLEATVTMPTAAERKMLDEAMQKEPKAAGASAAQVDIATKNTNPPLYPVEAAQKGIDGRVMLIVDVAADGSVEKLGIEKSEPAGIFDQAVLDAASKWRFEPALDNGKPVAGRVRVPVDFRADPPAQAPESNG